MKAEYKLALEALDATRRRVVREGDEDAARELVRWACKIARAEVNTPVATSEVWLWQHYTGEATARFHADSWASIDRWADALESPVAFLRLNKWEKWDTLQDEVSGLGPTKAAMAVALMGDQMGCIDIHGAAAAAGVPTCIRETVGGRLKKNPAAHEAYKRMTKRSAYRASHDSLYGKRARDEQWRNFWHLQDQETKGSPGADFQRSAHMPFFTVLFAVTGEVA